MAVNPDNKADTYRRRAAEADEMAGSARDETARNTWLDLARQWRDLARQADEREL